MDRSPSPLLIPPLASSAAADAGTSPALPRRTLLRRTVSLATGVAIPTGWWTSSWAQGRLRTTPSQTEGPFYPVEIPADSDSDLLVNGSRTYSPRQQPRVKLDGTVVDVDGKPLKGGVVEIWQCDEHGHYHHPGDRGRADPSFQGFGRATVDAEGRYAFVTMRPAPYSGRTPHIHVKVKLGGRELLTTQLYVEGDPGNERDGLWRNLRTPEARAALTVPFAVQPDGWSTARFPIVVAA